MNKEDYYLDDFCMFCNEKAGENWVSGSYETYLVCGCKGRERWYNALKELRLSEALAKKRKEYNLSIGRLKQAQHDIKRNTLICEQLEKEIARMERSDVNPR